MYIELQVIFCAGLYTYHTDCSLIKHRIVLSELCALLVFLQVQNACLVIKGAPIHHLAYWLSVYRLVSRYIDIGKLLTDITDVR